MGQEPDIISCQYPKEQYFYIIPSNKIPNREIPKPFIIVL
jgi:hypothetical protein